MAGDLATFQFPATGQQIRVIEREGEPWFFAADLCAALEIANPRDAVRSLDEDETDDHAVGIADTMITKVVSEAGLYSLILRSRKAEARAFQRWVTHEVLPAIRRTGRYEPDPVADGLAAIELATQRTMQAIAIAKAERVQRALAEAKVAELEPDAARARQTMDAHGLSLVGTVAKRFGIKEKALREFLYGEQLLIRDGTRRNEPYAALVQSGHFQVKATLVEVDPDRPAQVRNTTYVTARGEALIWKRLYEAGYVRSRQMPPRQLELLAAV